MPRKTLRILALLVLLLFLALPFAAMISSAADSVPPYLQIVSPEGGEVLPSSFTLEYVSSDELPHAVHIYVDSVLWEEDIPTPYTVSGLADGQRSIALVAVNSLGLQTHRSVLVTVDGTAPMLQFTHPSENQTLDADDVVLNWTVQDVHLRKLLLFMDGDEVDVTGLESYLWEDLYEGPHQASLWGEDLAGNNVSVYLNFSVDTGRPVLLFLSPEKNSYHPDPDLRVDWVVQPATATVTYSLDGGAWTAGAMDGVDLAALAEGRHTISVNVSHEGLYSQRSLSFYIDGTGPVLRIVSPLPGMRFGGGTAALIWDADDISGYSSRVSLDGGAWQSVEGDSLLLSGLSAGLHTATVNVSDAAGNSMQADVSFHNRVTDVPLGPLTITSDSSLRTLASIYDFPGDGSEADPYVISGMGFNAAGSSYGIMVQDTTLHLRIQDCLVFNTSSPSQGFSLQNVRNLHIQGCVAREQDHGLYLRSMSQGLSLLDNDFSRSRLSGITLNNADDCRIVGNDCSQAGRWGIVVGWSLTVSEGLNITDNDCSGHGMYGIAVEMLRNGSVARNDVSSTQSSSVSGVYLFGGTSSTGIVDNDCRENEHGILISGYSNGNNISNNDCRNSSYGVRITGGANENLISENDCRDNPYGIHLEGAEDNVIRANDCSQSDPSDGYGIYLSDGGGNLVDGNNCSGNRIGIFANRTSFETIVNNDCSHSQENAILLSGIIIGFNISNNDCSYAGSDAIWGETSYVVFGNTIGGNDCRHNNGSGINVSSFDSIASNSLIGNDCRDSPYDLIYITGANFSSNTFRDNILSDAPYLPIRLLAQDGSYQYTTFQGNDLRRSSSYGLYLEGTLTQTRVLGNNISNATLDAVHILSAVQMDGVYVDGNDVSSPGGDAVNISAPSIINGSVSTNLILSVPDEAIFLDSASLVSFSVDDNICPNHHRLPMNISAPVLQEVSVSGNGLQGCAAGILLLDRQFWNVSVSRNNLTSIPGTLIHLQSHESASGLHVDGNQLMRIGGQGILVDVDTSISSSSFNGNNLTLLHDLPLTIVSPVLQDVQVNDNICPDAADNPLLLVSTSIHSLQVNGNDLRRSSGDALNISAQSIGSVEVSGNDLRYAVADAVRIHSPQAISDCRVADNLLQDNGGHGLWMSSDVSLAMVEVEGNDATSSPVYPIRLQAPSLQNVDVTENTMYNAPQQPLWLQSSQLQGISIIGNLANNSHGYGLEINGTLVRDINISGNAFDDSVLLPLWVSSVNDLRSVHVLDNGLNGSSAQGALVHSDGDIFDLRFNGNTLLGHTGHQIVASCQELSSSAVRDNIATSSPLQPLSIQATDVDRLTVSGNVFSASGSYGIHVTATSLVSLNVTDNDLRNSVQDGLLLESTGAMHSITVAGNDARFSAGAGIKLSAPGSVWDLTISENDLRSVGGDPIRIEAGNVSIVSVHRNLCPDAASTPLVIITDAVDGLSVTGNDFNRSGSHGVNITAASISALSIVQNHIRDADGDGVRIICLGNGSLDDVLVRDNEMQGAAGNALTISATALSQTLIQGNNLSIAIAHAISITVEDSADALEISGNDCQDAGGDALSLSAGSSASQLSDIQVLDNLLTGNGGHGIRLDARSIRSLLLQDNDASGSFAPLVMDCEFAENISILNNNLSGSQQYGIRLVAEMRGISIIGNDLRQTQGDAVTLISNHSLQDLQVNGNSMESLSGNGTYVQAPSLLSVTIQGNGIDCPSGIPIWLSASDSQALMVFDNDCQDAFSSALRLWIDYMNDTLVQGNNLSGAGGDGLNISALNISDMEVSDNVITDAGGDGIRILSVEGIESLVLRNNDMGACIGDAIDITSSGLIHTVIIDRNTGDGMLRVDAPIWQDGSITDNVLTGSIAAYCNLAIDIQDIRGNQIGSNDIILLSGVIEVQSLNENQGGRLLLTASSGKLNVSGCNDNRFTGEWIWQSEDVMSIGNVNDNHIASAWFFSFADMAFDSVDGNLIGPVANNGLYFTAANISVSSIDGNDISADVNAIWLEANGGRMDIGTCDNNSMGTYGNVITLQASTATAGSISGNLLTAGMPKRFLFAEADELAIGAFQDNMMSVDSLHEAVKILAPDMEFGTFQGNRLRGGMTIIADTLQMGSFLDNRLQGLLNISVDGPLVWGHSIGNTMPRWVINAHTVQMGAIDNNTLDTDMAFVSNGNLSIGDITSNELQDIIINATDMQLGAMAQNQARDIILQSSTITAVSLDDNVLSGSIHISSFAGMQAGSVSGNSAVNLSIHGGDVSIGDMVGNALSGVMDIDSASLGISSLVANTASAMDIQGSGLSIGPMRQNVALGDIDLRSDSNLSISIIQSNQGRNISIDADAVITGGIRQNDLAGSLTVNAPSGMSIVDIADNDIQGSLSLLGGAVQVHDGIMNNNISQGISIEASSSTLPVISGNNLSACPGHGISWLSAGPIQTVLQDNTITAWAVNDGFGIRLQADSINLLADGITVSGFQRDAVNINAPTAVISMQDSFISSIGDGLDVTAITLNLSLSQVNVSADGVGLSLHSSQMQLQMSSCQLHGGSIALDAHGLESFSMTDCLVYDSSIGLVLRGSSMEITASEFRDNGVAVQAEDVTGILFHDNLVMGGSGDGLQLTASNDIVILNNSFQENAGFAFRALGCVDMLVAWNEFTANNGAGAIYDPSHLQCYDDGGNNWSAPRFPDSEGWEGNVWSDWLAPDADNDGIVDIQYIMEGGASDLRPLTRIDDIYPPHLRIISPTDGSKYSQGWLELQWLAMDNRSGLSIQPVTVELDGIVSYQSWDYQGGWNISIAGLSEGWHTITVRAMDNDGNAASASISFLVDRSAPSLSNVLPMEGSVHGSTVSVQWDVYDVYDTHPRCDIRVDGGAWTEDVSSPHVLSPLSEGLHVIELRAVDHLNNSVVVSRQIRVDLTAPSILIQSPSADALLDNGDVELRWTTSDLSDHGSFVSTDNSTWIADDSGTRMFHLADGEHRLYVKAVDEVGNTAYRNVSFRVDSTAPAVTIDSPSSDTLFPSGSVIMGWTVLDASDWTAEVSSGGLWTSLGMVSSHEFSGLADGVRTLYLRVTDAAGNVRSESVIIRVDSTAPVLSITQPSNLSAGNSSQVTLRWSLSDFSDCVVQVWWGANAPETVLGDSHAFDLPDGIHQLHVRATDEAGWSTERWVTVTVDSTPPSLVIDSPVADASILTATVQVDWTTDGVRSEVSIDGSAFQAASGTASFPFTQSGSHNVTVRSYDSLDNMAQSSVSFQVSLTTVSARSPEGQSVSAGNTTISLLLDKAPGTLTVQVNGMDAVYSIEGNYVNISLELMVDTTYNVSVTGTGADGSQIVGGVWEFRTEVETLGTAVVLAAALFMTGAVFVLVRPRGRRF